MKKARLLNPQHVKSLVQQPLKRKSIQEADGWIGGHGNANQAVLGKAGELIKAFGGFEGKAKKLRKRGGYDDEVWVFVIGETLDGVPGKV